MKNSGISSKANSPPNSAPPRRSFALTGRSRPLDPRTNAVRGDIADIRLAEQVFAPHYAEAVAKVVARDVVLREGRDAASDAMATLAAGEPFELLDLTGGVAWGIAPAHGLVGYLDAASLGAAGPAV